MHRAGCRREDHPAIGRRHLLQVGGLSLLGTGLADLLRLESHAAAAGQHTLPARAKAVVFIFQSGGPSQHETFDPKPEAPAGIRGDYGVTQTRLSGINFCEHLPNLAKQADKLARLDGCSPFMLGGDDVFDSPWWWKRFLRLRGFSGL